MKRSEVNQRILDLYRDPSYLEIGVDAGETFHAVKAARKVAVDPDFKFDVKQRRAAPESRNSEYVAVPSDEYFSRIRRPEDTFDVIFIDGLHLFDQVLGDLLNAVMCLKEDGIVIVDDVFPSSYLSSLPDLHLMLRYNNSINSPNMTWMGDVYRVVLFVEQYLPLFSYATVLENHGQMVMWRDSRPVGVKHAGTVEAICRAEYAQTVLDRQHFNFMPFLQIEERLKNRPRGKSA